MSDGVDTVLVLHSREKCYYEQRYVIRDPSKHLESWHFGGSRLYAYVSRSHEKTKQSANLLIQLRPADKTLQAAVDRLGGRLLDCESLWESASKWRIELVSKSALDCINHHTMFCPVAPSMHNGHTWPGPTPH